MCPFPYKTETPANGQSSPPVTPSHPPLAGRDIVIVGLQPWYFATGCNAKNIALLLAEHNRVLYVNFPIKRKAYMARNGDPKIQRHVDILKNKQERLHPIGNNIWEYYPANLIDSVNWLPFTSAFSIVNYFNNRKFARDIRDAMTQLQFKDIILFNDNDVYNGYSLKNLLSPSLYIYYFRDFLQGYPYWKKHTSILEPKLIAKSDLVVANSTYYQEYSSRINPHSYYIGQGCDLSHFDYTRAYSVPDDIAHLDSPIIGYIGALDSARLDQEIIATIARARPSWNIVLVGPEDDAFRQGPLHAIPNVHFMGGKPFNQLPAYVQAFDVCINPQFSNEITRGNYPLKIDEYLAMGKPTVATRTLAMKIFETHTYLADRPESYPALIDQALTEDTPARRMERILFAHSHTWENTMTCFYQAIDDTIRQKTNS